MDTENDSAKLLLDVKKPKWWRVLPALAIMITITTVDGLILNDFIEDRYAKIYETSSNTNHSAQNACRSKNQSSTTTPANTFVSTTASPQDEIQAATARLNVYISLAATLPSVFTSILLGANCDRTGRKLLILLPFLGKIMRYIIFLFVVIYDLSNTWIIIAVTFDGFFGTAALTILSSFAYVSDCTDKKNRTKGVIVADVCIACNRFLPLLTMGLYLEKPRYLESTSIVLAVTIAAFFFTLFLQPESIVEHQHLNPLQQLKKIDVKLTKDIFKVFLRKRSKGKQRNLLLLIGAHLCVIVMICGHLSMYYIYLYGAPFCMDSFGVSLNTTAQSVLTIILTIPYTLSRAKNSDHLILPIIGSISFIVQLSLFGIAKTIWLLYVAMCSAAIFNVLIPVIRSRITKLVDPHEYAVVFILASIFESGGYYAVSAICNEIYEASIVFFPGLVYFFIALFGILSIFLLS